MYYDFEILSCNIYLNTLLKTYCILEILVTIAFHGAKINMSEEGVVAAVVPSNSSDAGSG